MLRLISALVLIAAANSADVETAQSNHCNFVDGEGNYVLSESFVGPSLKLPNDFMKDCEALKHFDFGGVAISAIGDSAFENCINLESIDIPPTVLSVGDYAFSSNYMLSSVTFSTPPCLGLPCTWLQKIGVAAFKNTNVLRLIQFPNKLQNIEDDAFRGSALKSVTLPRGAAASQMGKLPPQQNYGWTSGLTVGDGAFAECGDLKVFSYSLTKNKLSDFAFFDKGTAEDDKPKIDFIIKKDNPNKDLPFDPSVFQ